MKLSIQTGTFFVALIFGTSGCVATITDPGKGVMLVTALSATEAKEYEEIGPIECAELTKIPHIEESCRNQLRNKAASKGADILAIASRDHTDCRPDKTTDCLRMTARAYEKKPNL